MKKYMIAVLLVVVLACAGVFTVKREFYVYATSETESFFYTIFDVKKQIEPYVHRQCFSWRADGDKSGWREASHFRTFHENFVMRDQDWIVLLTSLHQTLAGQLSLNGSRVLRRIGSAEKSFGFDYAVGNTLGTVMVYPTKVGAACFDCANVSAEEVAVRLDIFVRETWYEWKPEGAAVEKFVKDRLFEKTPSAEEDTDLKLESDRSHNPTCADGIRTKLLEKQFSYPFEM